jgi:transposase
MLGLKVKLFKIHPAISLENLVPQNNFYRHVEAKLDLSFVRDLVKAFYSSSMGRPSIDPVVFFKLQLIMFFVGIRSERQLMETVNLNLAHRWYIGYNLDEEVPDHSSLTKIRERYGLEIYLRFFEHIVERCIEAGLVWGQELYFDGTKVQANADIDTMVPRFYYEAKQQMKALFGQEQTNQPAPDPLSEPPQQPASLYPSRSFTEKYSGTRLSGVRQNSYQRTTDVRVSPTDPDAAPMKSSNDAGSMLGYHDHYVVDGGKARIILAAQVTPASIMDNTPMLDLARWVRFRWHVHPRIAVGDTKYGTIPNIVGLEQDGIKAYFPITDLSQRTPFYPATRFTYDSEHDGYICPQGQELPLWSRRTSEQVFVYRADAKVCNACALKSQCTDSQSGRHIFRSFFQEYLDRVVAYHATEEYKKAMRKRQVWVEPLFGEAKMFHGLRRFRLRRLWRVNIEGLLIAAGQNLKRLLSYKGWGKRQGPGGWSVAVALFPEPAFLLQPHHLSLVPSFSVS